MINKVLRRIKWKVLPLYKKYLSLLKVREDRVVFVSYPSYSDNPKLFFLYLHDESPCTAKFIWLIDEDAVIPEKDKRKAEYIKLYSKIDGKITFRALKALATSKSTFFSHGLSKNGLVKKQGQYHINLWHGCGYKDIKPTQDSSNADFALVTGGVYSDIMTRMWGCPREIVQPLGYPRYDLYKKNADVSKRFIEKIFGTIPYAKVIVWMPTFRQSNRGDYKEKGIVSDTGLPLICSKEELIKCNKFCVERELALIIKRHPSQPDYAVEKLELSNIKFVSNEDLLRENIEIYSLLAVTNGLITDYSSVAIDYLLLNKMMAFALEDFDVYGSARGFLFDNPLDFMPGHHLKTFADFQDYLEDVSNNNDIYESQRKKVLELVHNPCDNYCERIYFELQKRGML